MATELDKIFSGNKPCQLWINAQRFGDNLRLHHQGNDGLLPEKIFIGIRKFIYLLTKILHAMEFLLPELELVAENL
jgi:hypothetical protein